MCAILCFCAQSDPYFIICCTLRFTLDDGTTKKSVVQYFREKYNIGFKYLSLPALQAGSDTKPIYLPMEVFIFSTCLFMMYNIFCYFVLDLSSAFVSSLQLCHIAAGQRYSKRLNEEQVTALLRATCQRPHDRENYIKQVLVLL